MAVDDFSSNFQIEEEFIPSVAHLNNIKTNRISTRILHLNIISLNKNFRELQVLVETFLPKPDIIICTETWKIECPGFYQLAEYNLTSVESDITKAGGVVAYVHKKYSETQMAIKSKKVGKIAVIDIEIGSTEKIYITGIYRPHKVDKQVFVDTLKDFLEQNRHRKNHMIIGDMNLDILDCNDVSENYLNNYCELGYSSYINSITRPSEHDGTCIDHLFFKQDNISVKAYILEKVITDHHMIVADIGMIVNSKIKEEQFFVDTNKLKENSSKCNWNELLQCRDVNVCVAGLVGKISEVVESSKKICKRNENKKRKSWITLGLVKSCETKKKMSLKLKNDPNNSVLKAKYKKYVAILYKLLERAEEMYDEKRVSKIQNDNKLMWKYVNSKIGRDNRKKKCAVKKLRIKEDTVVDPQAIANGMNEFFSNVGKELLKRIKNPKRNVSNVKKVDSSIYFWHTDRTEVVKTVLALGRRTAAGPDGITVSVLQTILCDIVDVLVHVINLCIDTGVCPDHFKRAVITPVHKTGDVQVSSNYRPISLISNLSKVFEKIIKSRICKFLEKHKILHNNQFGFRSGRSADDALEYVTNLIYKNLDKERPTIGIF